MRGLIIILYAKRNMLPIFFSLATYFLLVDDYRYHTSCITEAERYEKTVYKGPKKNDTKNRKLTPQEVWMSVINESLNDCPPSLTSHVRKLLAYDNVPRKEKAFKNFASNSLKLYGNEGELIILSLWKHLSAVRQRQSKKKEDEQKKKQESEEDVCKIINDDKKGCNENENEVQNNTEEKPKEETQESTEQNPKDIEKIKDSSLTSTEKDEKKKVLKAIKKALKKAPKHVMKFKEIRQLMKAQKLLSMDLKKDEMNDMIKSAVTKGKKSLKMDGKKVTLIDK